MKKVSTLVITLLLGAGLVMAQTGGDKSSLNRQPLPPGKKTTTTATKTKTKKSHKGAKKGKKSSSSTTTPAPK